MRAVLPRLTASGADVFTVGTPQAVVDSTSGIAMPPGIPEELSPILEILPTARDAPGRGSRGGLRRARGLFKVALLT
jgi:hypothetical protein